MQAIVWKSVGHGSVVMATTSSLTYSVLQKVLFSAFYKMIKRTKICNSDSLHDTGLLQNSKISRLNGIRLALQVELFIQYMHFVKFDHHPFIPSSSFIFFRHHDCEHGTSYLLQLRRK